MAQYPGTDPTASQPPAPTKPAKKPFWKRWWFILLAVLVVLGIFGNLGGGSQDDSSSTAASSGGAETTETSSAASADTDSAASADSVEQTTAPAAESDEPASTATFAGQQDQDVAVKPGESVTIKGVTVTAADLFAGDSTFGATTCSTVSLKNGSGDTVDFNLYDWKLQQPSGTIVDPTFTGSDNILSDGQIVDGGSATGDVCFDVDSSVSGEYVLIYQNVYSWSSDRAAWVTTK